MRSLKPKGPQKVKIFEGENLTRTCIAVGVPMPQIYWKYEDTTIISKKGFDLTFTLTNTTTEDNSGKYSCMALNQFGFEEQYLEVKVVKSKCHSMVCPEGCFMFCDIQGRGPGGHCPKDFFGGPAPNNIGSLNS